MRGKVRRWVWPYLCNGSQLTFADRDYGGQLSLPCQGHLLASTSVRHFTFERRNPLRVRLALSRPLAGLCMGGSCFSSQASGLGHGGSQSGVGLRDARAVVHGRALSAQRRLHLEQVVVRLLLFGELSLAGARAGSANGQPRVSLPACCVPAHAHVCSRAHRKAGQKCLQHGLGRQDFVVAPGQQPFIAAEAVAKARVQHMRHAHRVVPVVVHLRGAGAGGGGNRGRRGGAHGAVQVLPGLRPTA